MKLLVVAVGQRQPAWADAAWADFAKRFPPEMRLELKALKAEPRGSKGSGSKTAAQCMAAEALRFVDFVRQAKATQPESPTLVPGDMERQTRTERLRDGIPLPDETWQSIVEAARVLGVSAEWETSPKTGPLVFGA